MKRRTISPRENWEHTVEEQGLVFHHTQGKPYWDESAFYEFTAKEVDVLEAATNELTRMCLEAGQKIIDQRRYMDLGIPEKAWAPIEDSWNREPPAIYGRMDLAYDGINPPKLLEYNADTPTALIEAAVIQWYWLQDFNKGADQFNSIHERLIAKWKELTDYSPAPLYFAHLDDAQGEDTMTTNYMRDTAEQAGWKTEAILMNDIGWDSARSSFVDMDLREMRSVFKLYPWEWMVHEEFGDHALATLGRVNWIEPIWKMLWSNKGVLPILWELFPGHQNLLPAYFDGPHDIVKWVKKPKMSREGQNITLYDGTETGGDYGEEGFVWQELGPVPQMDGQYPVIGSWVIDEESAGMGIREGSRPITDNLSSFVPHLFG